MIIASIYSIWNSSIEYRSQQICRVYFPKNPDGENKKYDIW
jgi:hypothetical protein